MVTTGTNGSSSRKTLALVATSLGWLLFSLDLTVVTVALPTIGSDFSAPVAHLQWAVSGYAVTVAALLLASGVWGDRVGASRVYEVGLIVFGLASIVSALAPNLAALILGRVGQGAGGAAMTATGLALLSQAYGSDAAGRTRAVGWWAAIGGIGGSLGILVGGVVVSEVGWRPLFWLNLPIVAIALILTRRLGLPAIHGTRSIDGVGLVASVVVIAGAVGALALAPDGQTFLAVVLVAAAVIAAVIAVVRQRRASDPVIPRSVLGSPDGRRSLLLALVVNTQFYAALLAMTMFFQKGLGWSAAITGLAFLPAIIPTPIAMPIVGRLAARHSPERILLVLTGLGAVGFALLALSDAKSPYVLFGTALLMMTLGTSAIVVAPLTRMLMANIDPSEAGAASGALTMMRQVGASVGAASLVLLAGSQVDEAASRAGILGVALAVVAVVLLITGRSRTPAS